MQYGEILDQENSHLGDLVSQLFEEKRLGFWQSLNKWDDEELFFLEFLVF